MEMGGSSSSSESHLLKIGLKFGRRIYFEDLGVGDDAQSEGGSSPVSGGGGPQKKGRTGGDGVQGGLVKGLGSQPPRCQVEGCNLDLSDAKTYYSRHKVCGVHSKTAKVIVNGLEQRFCQQCSRFHQLPEFDQGKRSCRRRLAGHNERRRKPTSRTILSACDGSLPSIFENDNSGGILLDFSSCSRARIHWPNTREPTATEKLPPPALQSNLDKPPPYINPNAPPGLGGSFNGVHDSHCALSLLSNHSSASRSQPLSHEYYVNPGAGVQMVQPPTGTMVQVQGHFSTAWGYDTDETHSGLSQIPESGYSDEIGLSQQDGRRYGSSVEHIDWSL